MKKKVISISLVLFAFCAVLVGGLISAHALENEQVNYSQKSAYDSKEDGWVYTFEIYYPDDNSDKVYMFDGYNLKYKQLDGYYVPVIDSTTKKEINRITPEYITLSISEESKKDIEDIVEYFNNKQFNNNITLSDLDGLNITTISKEYLVDIFNRAINSDLKTEPGEYQESSFVGRVNIDSSDNSMPGEWQASYILDYGNIYKIDIEFIDENGIYLSDKQNSNELSTKESQLISQIEILENQSGTVASKAKSNVSSFKNTAEVQNSDLKKLMSELEKRLDD